MHTSDSSRPTITKKEACQILKIAYNPARLERIIEDYNDRIEFRRKRRQQKRGTRATPDEIQETIRSFLRGDGITHISASLYRSVPFVRSIIDSVGVPTRGSNQEERNSVYFLPEQCVSTEFEVGELVWSAKDHASATVIHQDTNIDYEKIYGSKCYQIYVHENSEEYEAYGPGYYSSALEYDLGSLKHLQEYNIDLKNIC